MDDRHRRVGIILGPHAWRYGQAIRASARWQLVGVWGPPDTWGGWNTITQAYETEDDFVRCRPEAVVIASPLASHAAHAERMLYRGVHSLIERPLAFDLATYDRLVTTSTDTGWGLQIALPKRLNQTTRMLAWWLRRATPPVRWEARVSVPRAVVDQSPDGDAFWREGFHALDRLIQGAGPVVATVFVTKGEMLARLHLTFASGATGEVEVRRTVSSEVSDTLTCRDASGRTVTLTDTRWGRWPWRFRPGTVESVLRAWADDLGGRRVGRLHAASARETHRVLIDAAARGVRC